MSDLISRDKVIELLQQVYCEVERYQGCPINSKEHKIFMKFMDMIDEIEDLKDFVSDIIAVNNNYNNSDFYYPEDLEMDFDEIMEKWSKKIEHYKWR